MSVVKKRAGVNQINHRTSLLVGGKNRKTKNGIKEQFTILSSSQNRKSFLKVLVPNKDPVEDLYKLFPQLPEGEKPINGFSCALHKDILLQGKMVICSNCICFHSNIFGYETRVIIFFKNVLAIKREKTAFVVPNAISIRTLHKRYLFCSFISRESSFKLLSRTWKFSMNPNYVDESEFTTKKRKKDKKQSKKSTDFNHNTLLTESISTSTNVSFYRNMSLPDRPHTSPPTLNASLEETEEYITSRNIFKDYGKILDEGVESENTSDNSSTSSSCELHTARTLECLGNGSSSSTKFRKSRSMSNLDDLSPMSYRACYRNLQTLKKKMELNNDDVTDYYSKGKIFSISERLCLFGSGLSSRVHSFLSAVWSLRIDQPVVLVISLLILLLAFLSLNVLIRLNSINDALNPTESSTNDNVKLNNLFSYKNVLHSAQVERVKSMLSVNLDTVTEVQKVLKELREKLNTDGKMT